MGSTSRAGQQAEALPRGTGSVIVLSRLQLMSQTVAAGLRVRGVDAVDLGWESGVHHAVRDLTEADVLLLLDDLEDRAAARATHALVSRSRARILVMTEGTDEPVWGALLASGAAAVMHTHASLDEVESALSTIRRGGSPMTEKERARHVRAWTRWSRRDEALRLRMSRLSAREHVVVDLLARGHSVAEIGAELSIAESTVRSHVKALRRKLDVGSQLAAVAIVHRLSGVVSGFPSGDRREQH